MPIKENNVFEPVFIQVLFYIHKNLNIYCRIMCYNKQKVLDTEMKLLYEGEIEWN